MEWSSWSGGVDEVADLVDPVLGDVFEEVCPFFVFDLLPGEDDCPEWSSHCAVHFVLVLLGFFEDVLGECDGVDVGWDGFFAGG